MKGRRWFEHYFAQAHEKHFSSPQLQNPADCPGLAEQWWHRSRDFFKIQAIIICWRRGWHRIPVKQSSSAEVKPHLWKGCLFVLFWGLFFCICLILVHINTLLLLLLHLGLLSEKIKHKALVWRGLARILGINQAAGPGTSRMSLCGSNNPSPQQLPQGLSQARSSPSLEGVAADLLELLRVWWAERIKLLLKDELRVGKREQIIWRGDWVWVISVHTFCV